MKYFVVTILYEEKEVITDPIVKDFVIETDTFPSLTSLLQSPAYAIEGYRRVGIAETLEISKGMAKSLMGQEGNASC